MRTMRSVRAIAAVATVFGAVLVAPAADAASYTMDIQIWGQGGGGPQANAAAINLSYGNLKRFEWADPLELAFTHPVDSTTGQLLGFAKSHAEIAQAELHVKVSGPPGTVITKIHLNGVHIQSVREAGSQGSTDNVPEETVVLRAEEAIYTFQPIGPTGQPQGAPVTVSFGHNH